jgi:diphthamide biosynthesis protein 2
VTPFELEIALQAQLSWTGKYVLDFGQLLAEHKNAQTATGQSSCLGDDFREITLIIVTLDEENVSEEDADKPMFSLVTGKYRQAKRYGGELSNLMRPSCILTRQQR